jgi:hypothetical protein
VVAGFDGDRVPQALVIIALIVAFAVKALAMAMLLRLFRETGRATCSRMTSSPFAIISAHAMCSCRWRSAGGMRSASRSFCCRQARRDRRCGSDRLSIRDVS